MNWAQFAVQWLHVLLGIAWFGYVISMFFLVGPALREMPEAQQRITGGRLGEIGSKVFPAVGLVVLLLGVLRGTVFGPIDSVDALVGTAYGITWLVALIATVALFYTGARHLAPQFRGLKDAQDFTAASARLRTITQVDLGLFMIIFTCMILMRFGV